jgi:hypothetical protein
MKYTIEWVEVKNPDWKLISLQSGEKEVSVNRTSKKGEVFPNFDNLAAGIEVEGELWQSQAGKWYLFPPKANPMGPRPAWAGKGGIAKAQETKREDIKNAQENKELGIKVSSTMNKAVEIALAENGPNVIVASDFQERTKYWRQWLWSEWEKHTDLPPF